MEAVRGVTPWGGLRPPFDQESFLAGRRLKVALQGLIDPARGTRNLDEKTVSRKVADL
jgi:hypothetical protein